MNIIRKYIILLIVVLWGTSAPTFAQLEVRVSPEGTDYMLGEDVSMCFLITNRMDAPISLINTPGRCWLFLNVTRLGDTSNLAPSVVPRYPNLTIPPGSQRRFKFNLSPAYRIRRPGKYFVTATLILPDRSTFTSRAAVFNVHSGANVQTFRVRARGQQLEISLRSMSINEGKTMLYGQVMNADTRAVIGACCMGEYLNFMQPRVMLDAALNLHMVCQSSPKYFTYAVMDTYGRLRDRKVMFQIGGPVELVSSGKGIRCLGLAPYVKPKNERSKYHSATERP